MGQYNKFREQQHTDIQMKTKILLSLLPLALAIENPKRECTGFLTINSSPQKTSRRRYRREPKKHQRFFFGGDSSGDDYGTTMAATTEQVTTVLVTTRDPVDNSTDSVSTNPVTTIGPETTEQVTTTTQSPATTTEQGTTTQRPATTTVQATTTQIPTTTEATTPKATTNQVTTTQNPTTVDITEPGTTVPVDSEKAIIVMLDETGSMQSIGGRGKGRGVVLNKMESFRRMLNKKVKNDRLSDQPITFVTFNEKARWNTYESIDQWPALDGNSYNPGYQTNLYDTMGCVLSEYKSRHPNHEASVYLISDGIHQMKRRKAKQVAYKEHEVNTMVEDLRNEGWNFNFYGATDESKKEKLKEHAIDLGFRAAETLVFDFNGKELGALLKTILKTMVKGNQQEDEEEDKKSLPACEKCAKGRAGKMCRIRRKNAINLGHCIKV